MGRERLKKVTTASVGSSRHPFTSLDETDLLGLWALLALTDSELYAIILVQAFEPVTCDLTEVYKEICISFIRCDKAEAFATIEPFDCSYLTF